MANAYLLVATEDFEIVAAASGPFPERRFRHYRGELYTARTKAAAESMVKSGRWAWEDCEVNRNCNRSPLASRTGVLCGSR